MTIPLWTPPPERIAQANLTRFMAQARARTGLPLNDYPSLYEWSIAHPEAFWPEVWDFCGIHATQRWDKVLSDGDRMPGARWFEGSRLNFAENLLPRRDESPAIIAR
ncbi:MAG: acetyl-coenzyme A synthetase N-terminal domain-containing protein, partial [Chromatiales bacterium]